MDVESRCTKTIVVTLTAEEAEKVLRMLRAVPKHAIGGDYEFHDDLTSLLEEELQGTDDEKELAYN